MDPSILWRPFFSRGRTLLARVVGSLGVYPTTSLPFLSFCFFGVPFVFAPTRQQIYIYIYIFAGALFPAHFCDTKESPLIGGESLGGPFSCTTEVVISHSPDPSPNSWPGFSMVNTPLLMVVWASCPAQSRYLEWEVCIWGFLISGLRIRVMSQNCGDDETMEAMALPYVIQPVFTRPLGDSCLPCSAKLAKYLATWDIAHL